jgi:hypothetical protein
MAVTTKTPVKKPRATWYKNSKLEESTNKLIPMSKYSSALNYTKIEPSIKLFILIFVFAELCLC